MRFALSSRTFAVTLAAAGIASFSSALNGQSADRHSGVLITGRELALVGAATAGSLGIGLADVPLAHAFTDSAFHARHPGLTTAAKRASVVTETVLMLSSATVWGGARLSHSPATADVALHTFESVASAAMVIQVVRGVLGRARPYVIDETGEKRDSDPHDFQLLHGFTSFNYRSYPSMHAMASFAAATALVQEMRLRGTPNRAIYAPLLYTAATAPSLARMYLDEHWASDIAMGVFLGVFSGQKVVGYSHAHPDNYFDRKFLPRSVRMTITRDAHGFGLSLIPF